jgi:hypothetical protein
MVTKVRFSIGLFDFTAVFTTGKSPLQYQISAGEDKYKVVFNL